MLSTICVSLSGFVFRQSPQHKLMKDCEIDITSGSFSLLYNETKVVDLICSFQCNGRPILEIYEVPSRGSHFHFYVSYLEKANNTCLELMNSISCSFANSSPIRF